MGCSSTHRSSTSGTTGVDTTRVLVELERLPDRRIIDLPDGFKGHVMPELHLLALEGNPAAGGLWTPDELLSVVGGVRDVVDDTFGVRADRGVSRLDTTTSRAFLELVEGRTFLQGMAAMEFPRLEGRRRPNVGQARSIDWTGARTAAIKCRVYDESFKVAGRELGQRVRLEDQRRFPNGHRPPLEVAADPEWQRASFLRRFEPMRKAVTGVTAASLPVVERALVDEVKYGYRTHREAERLLGAMVFLRHGEGSSYPKATLSRRRRELREAGYVVVDHLAEPVEVDLGQELERALDEFGA